MTSSLIYGFNVYSNLYSVLIFVEILAVILTAVLVVLYIMFKSDSCWKEEVPKTIYSWCKRSFVGLIILSVMMVFAPSPKTLVMMYGVDYLQELNTNANVTTTQLYKDVTTIIHNYAVGSGPKKEK